MKKKIHVMLTQNHLKLGPKGHIIKVSSGFAFNYLIPHNLAQKVTQGLLKHNNMFISIQSKKEEKNQQQAQSIQQYLNHITHINLYKKTGDYQHIFGTVTEKEIIHEIHNITGINLSKKNIHIPNINTIGLFSINITLTSEIKTTMTINIIPNNI